MLRCHVCRSRAERGTKLALAALRDYVGHDLPRLPKTAGLCAVHARSSTFGLFYEVERHGREVVGLSLLDGRSVLRAECADDPTPRVAPAHVIRKWRARVMGPQTKCMCGSPAVHVGHRIPLLCFRLSRLDTVQSYFAGNLDPVCRECNIDWMHFCNPKPRGSHQDNSWLCRESPNQRAPSVRQRSTSRVETSA